jgi:hypothetical protein
MARWTMVVNALSAGTMIISLAHRKCTDTPVGEDAIEV